MCAGIDWMAWMEPLPARARLTHTRRPSALPPIQDEYVLAKVLEVAKGREVKVGEPVALSVEDAAAFEAFAELDKQGKIELPGAAAPAPAAPAAAAPAPAVSATPAPAASSSSSPPAPPSHLGPFALSPAARHLLESRSLELFKDVQGTGKGGRITKADVIHAIANGQVATKVRAAPAPPTQAAAAASSPAAQAHAAAPAAPAPGSAAIPEIAAAPGSFVDSKNSNMRKVIARRLAESKASVPHSYETVECGESSRGGRGRGTPPASSACLPIRRADWPFLPTPHAEIDAVLKLRKRLQKEYEAAFSVNDAIIRSAALALRDVPEVRGDWEGKGNVSPLPLSQSSFIHHPDLNPTTQANAAWDGKKGAAVVNPSVDISVAVATPTGLITPIITGSDRRGLTDISAKMKDLAGRARQGKLKPEEFQGGSFTISNLGMFGIDEFSAVINPPQAAIMAVGRGSKRVRVPAYAPGQDAKALKPYTATIMTATLSFDRRVLDDAVAAQFLQAFKSYISRPELLLL